MKILVLDMNLFPDAHTVRVALETLGPEDDVKTLKVSGNAEANVFRAAVNEVMTADLVVTL
ncbi:MAG: hypothetical protein COB59_01445 [Rhodospirillaceae bacterium]|nr:MAG: hypothetical protein COB59_01445 [Rhodospirillaceae bacterium]